MQGEPNETNEHGEINEANKYLIFMLGAEIYGIPLMNIKSIEGRMNIIPIPQTPDYVKGITNLRGKIIPILDLKSKFNIGVTENNDRTCVIISEVVIGGVTHVNGLIVDSVSEVEDISDGYIEPVPQYGKTQIDNEFLAGIGKVKDKVIILLDIPGIMESFVKAKGGEQIPSSLI